MISDFLTIDLEKELNLGVLPESEREKIIADMEGIIFARINSEVLERLDDSQKKELDVLLDTDGDIFSFYNKSIPGFSYMVAEIVASFKEEMLELKSFVAEKTA